MADAGIVHLDPEIVAVRVVRGLLDQRFAVAETDFEHDRRVPAEQGFKRQFGIGKFHAKRRPEFVERAGLRSLSEGQKVEYELTPGRNGKSSAENLVLID